MRRPSAAPKAQELETEAAPQPTLTQSPPAPVQITPTTIALQKREQRMTKKDNGFLLYLLRLLPQNRLLILILGALIGFWTGNKKKITIGH